MKIKKKKYLLVSICALVFAIAGVWRFYQVYAATSSDFYLFYDSDEVEGADIELSNEYDTLYVKSRSSGGGLDLTNGSINWSSSRENVVELEPISGDPTAIKLVRKAPGISKIDAIIEQDGLIYTLTCKVKVDYEINKNISPFKPITTSDKEAGYPMVLEGDINATVPAVTLQYKDNQPVDTDRVHMVWDSMDINVVEIDSNGQITVKGAGETDIEVSTDSSVYGEPITKEFHVIVQPKVKNPLASDSPFERHIDLTYTDFTTPLRFDTNAVDASKLEWKFYDEKFNTLPDGRISYITNGDKFIVTDAKAGTYYIRGYVDKEYIPSTLKSDVYGEVGFIQIKLTVNINVNETSDVLMNVGDTYSVVENSNIPSYDIFSYESTDQSVLEVSNTGIVTATGVGDADVILTVIGSNPVKTYTIHFKVIDGISLNYTYVKIYTSGTVTLKADVTNQSQKVIWTSKDPAIATVGQDGLVTGIKEGSTTITASQTINGVIKSATCTVDVRASVNKITLNPDDVTLNLDEKITVSADIEPEGFNNVSLKWLSSDEDVVTIENAYDLSATIKGTGPGTAVITAINQENVVVGYCHVTVKEKVTKITLSTTSVTTQLSKKNYQLSAYVTPETATNKKINWKTTNSRVATVDSNGLVTLVSAGTASIIATSDDNPAVTAICNITVEIPASSLTLDEKKKELYVGDTYRLGYVVTPTNAANTDVTWSSSNSSVASVNSSGLITAKAVGQAIITVKTKDGTLSASCTITVKQKATGISLDVTNLELYVDQSYDLEVTVTPASSNDYTLTWESSNTSVATVDEDGKITAVAAGEATITVKTSNGQSADCYVTVKEQVTGIQLNYKEKTVIIGEKFTIKATIVPSSAADEVKVSWSSSKTSVATVSSSGVISGLKGGTAVITCKTDDGRFTAFCVVTVVERVTSVKLNKTNTAVGVGKSYTLKATVKTNAATKPAIKWTSSNTKYATVDSNGKVSGKAIGTVTITAAAQDGSKVKATCIIRVVKQTTSITMNKTSVTTVEGRTFRLTATVRPSNATYKTLNWSSGDEKVAIVDSSGNVTALAEGTVTIKAAAKDNSGKTAACFVIVQKRTPANSVTIINQNLTMVVGETTTVQKAINPTTSTDRFTWESDNKTVASVDSSTGKVTARTPGTADITVMTESGKTATTKVTVVGLNTTNLVLEQYTDYRLSVIGITSGVTWDVADNEIAVVTNGLVSSRRIGTTTITATVNGRRLNCRLKVVKIK